MGKAVDLVVVIEGRNAELMETVAKEAKRLDITNGAIVSLIGAVDSFTISTAATWPLREKPRRQVHHAGRDLDRSNF